jgi:predicted ATPase/signal transduction histidine kinase
MAMVEGYDIRETLYDSPKSLVFRAARSADQIPVVLKILKNDYPSPDELTRYRREFEITRSLTTDRVIRAFEQRRYENTLMIVMEDFGGESLLRLMKRRRFLVPELVDIAIDAASALGEIHGRQIVHKDVNPGNLVMNPETGALKIIDFGIATRLSRENQVLRSPDVLEGTLPYMSPEQTGRMNRAVDYRTDFYSLGATLYQLFTGRLPFESEDAMEVVHSHIAKEPTPAHEVAPECPKALSRIIGKLMAKAAEDRYQSARGIVADLEVCRRALAEDLPLDEFAPGGEDRSERFQIPQKLYGRDAEIAAVLEVFWRVSAGPGEMLLVSGYSGVGKSALIQEVYKPLTRKRGYFIAGKFDQLQRSVPFSAFVSALRDLVRQLLTEGEARLERWKSLLGAALGPNGQVIVDMIPDVELIVGPQAPAPELGAAETMNRFNMVFTSFLRVFSGLGTPLVIFLDDLQWADSATLNLLDVLVTDDETEGLFLIGAYRDNEVDAMHPLTSTIQRIRKGGGRVSEITLRPLGFEDVNQLMVDTLHRTAEDVAPLTRLVVDKTQGNPFFVGQFLDTLHHEGLISFAAPPGGGGQPAWRWDVARIEAADITENVVELLLGKLRRLPEATQEALRLAACIGNRFDLATLSLIRDRDPARTHADLAAATQEGLILPTSSLEVLDPGEPLSPLLIHHYRFQHDRVQQSAYALFEGDEHKAVHLGIGRRLLATLEPARLADRLFEVVDHLDIGRALVVDPAERLRLAELNLTAGRKAMESTAYAAALDYLLVAREALPEDGWESAYALTAAVHRQLAEVEYLNGHFERSEEIASVTLARVRTDLERAEVYCVMSMQYTMMTKFTEAIEAGRKVFELGGLDLPLGTLKEAAGVEIGRVEARLQGRSIPSLVDLPDLTDPTLLVVQRAVQHLTIAAFLANQDLFPVVTAISVNISLEHGLAPQSALTFANYGLIIGAFMGRYREGYELGALGLALCERFHPHAPTATAHLVMGSELVPWVRHVRESIPILEGGYRAGMESGDILWAGYLSMYKVCHEAFQGKNLGALVESLPEILGATLRTKNLGAVNGMLAHLQVLADLAGVPPEKVVYQGEPLDEARFLRICEAHRSTMALCFHRILKAEASYILGDHAGALALTREVEGSLAYIINHVHLADHKLYQALAIAALFPSGSDGERAAWRAELEENRKRLAVWAETCPANFAHKHLLVVAEIARIDGDGAAAIDLYDQAIDAARANEFPQDQAVASELAGRYWLTRGRKERIAQMYLREARYAYELWGAQRKVEALEAEFPELLARRTAAAGDGRGRTKLTTTTTLTASRELDLASVLKASQAISVEIALEGLLQKLVRIVIENAGAQRGVILLQRADGSYHVEADGAVDAPEVRVHLGEPLATSREVSAGVVNYVIKTGTTVVLKDATKEGRFVADPHVVATRPKSVLCMPIVHHGKIGAVLYLENNLSEGAFTEDRLEVLRVLGTQAAISLENATLYTSLAAYNQTLEQKVEERTQDILRTRNQLIAQEKMAWMGTLSVGIAHEIKNPLNFVNNFTEMSVDASQELLETLEGLQGRVLDDDALDDVRGQVTEIAANMEKVRSYSRRADGVVDSMRSIAGGGSQEASEVDVNALVEEFSKLVHHSRTSKGGRAVEILKEYDATLGAQTVVPRDLGRVLTSVLSNAYEALEGKKPVGGRAFTPTILIQTVNLERHFEIRIRDNGVGIPEKHFGQIYAPFFTTKPAGSGHIGLGLAVTHDIVTLVHHGTITVDSTEGRSTEFRIRLPKDLAAKSLRS